MKAGRHVDADRLDGVGIGAMRHQIGGQRLDGLGTAPLGDEEYCTALGVRRQGHIVMAPSAGGLVNSQLPDLGEVGLCKHPLHVVDTDRHDPMQAEIDQARHAAEGHLLTQRQHQRLEQQREAGQPADPARLHLTDRTVRPLHARHADLQVALMLEEVERPETFADGVVHRMGASLSGQRKPAPLHKVDADRQRARFRIQVNARHIPRRGNTQGGLKYLLGHSSHVGGQ